MSFGDMRREQDAFGHPSVQSLQLLLSAEITNLKQKYEKAVDALRMIKGDNDPYNDGQYHSQQIWTAARVLRELSIS